MEVEFTSQNPTPIKQKGLDIRVYDTPGRGGSLLGTLTVTKTKLVWARSGVSVNTKDLDWEEFITLMEGL